MSTDHPLSDIEIHLQMLYSVPACRKNQAFGIYHNLQIDPQIFSLRLVTCLLLNKQEPNYPTGSINFILRLLDWRSEQRLECSAPECLEV